MQINFRFDVQFRVIKRNAANQEHHLSKMCVSKRKKEKLLFKWQFKVMLPDGDAHY